MDDDVFCLFVILACVLTLVIPARAQPLFAVFAFALAIAALLSPDTPVESRHGGARRQDRHDVNGG